MAQAAPDSATIDRWRQAIRSTTLAHYQYQMGIALARTGETNAAMESYKRALGQQPEHASARLRLITLLEGTPEGTAEAQKLRAGGQVLDRHFQETGALLLLADDLNIDTAHVLAERIVDQAQVHGIPDAVRGPILHELGQLLVRARQPERAETALALAHQISPTDVNILSLLATVRLQLGHLETLAQSLDKWLALVPGDPNALFHRGRLHLLRSEFAAADTNLEAAIAAGHADGALVLSFRIRGRLADRDPAGALALYDAAGQADRDYWVCQAYALLARLRLDPSADLTVEADALLARAGQQALARAVKCLALQARGENWHSLLSSLLLETPGAFASTVAAVIEAKAGGSNVADHWRKAKSFNDPYLHLHLMVLSINPDLITDGPGT